MQVSIKLGVLLLLLSLFFIVDWGQCHTPSDVSSLKENGANVNTDLNRQGRTFPRWFPRRWYPHRPYGNHIHRRYYPARYPPYYRYPIRRVHTKPRPLRQNYASSEYKEDGSVYAAILG